MCNSNNLLYTPKPHEFRAYRADGTRVHTGDKLVTTLETWDFVSCTHPRKINVEALEDPNGPKTYPNLASREFYPSVFNLGIYDMTDAEWTFPPSWDTSDIDRKLYEEFEAVNLTDADVWASYDKNVKADETANSDKKLEEARNLLSGDKTYTTDTERNKKFWANSDKFPNSAQDVAELEKMDREAPLHKTDMWELIDQMFQRVTKCDGTVILTPRPKTDKPGYSDEEVKAGKEHELHMLGESDIPWVSPGPSKADIAAQADRVRRADKWVETGVWNKSDSYTHEDAMRDLHEEEDRYETDIADDDDKAELIRESDEQAEINAQAHGTDNKA